MVFFDEFHNPLLNYEMSQFLFAYNNQTFCKKIHITATPVLEYNYCKNIDVFYISDKEITKGQLNTIRGLSRWPERKTIEH